MTCWRVLDVRKESFIPGSVEHARQNIFRKEDLIRVAQARTLRRVADPGKRGRQEVIDLSKSIDSVWPTRERLMVCVSAAKSQERLIAEGFRMAQRLQAECLAVHVQRPDEGDADRERLRSLARQAEVLQIEFLNVVGDDVAETLLECARTNNVTKLVLGHGSWRWNRPWRRQFSEQIARANPELGILLVAVKSMPRKTRLMGRESQPSFSASSLVITTAACAVTTLIAEWLFQFLDAPNLAALFTLTVVVVSLRLGRVAAIWCALLSVPELRLLLHPSACFLSPPMSDTQCTFHVCPHSRHRVGNQ